MRLAMNGLMDAMRWLAGLALVAAICAGAYVAVRGGPYVPRLGWALMSVGGIIVLCGPGLVTRMGSADGFDFVGKGPEMGGDSSRTQHLTGTGIAVMVGLPLIFAGGLLV